MVARKVCWEEAMRVFKGVLPVVVTLGLVSAVTAILWHINLTTAGSRGLVYIYLFPVVLIAALYNGRLALLCAAVAIVCADLFLQEPLYSLANDNPREYGDLIYFALLAVTAIKFIGVLARPNTFRPRASRLGRPIPPAD
jgi:K+-sensing histidine kinase KdpD